MHSYLGNNWKLTVKTNGNVYYCSLDSCLEEIAKHLKEQKLDSVHDNYSDIIHKQLRRSGEFEDDLFWLRERL